MALSSPGTEVVKYVPSASNPSTFCSLPSGQIGTVNKEAYIVDLVDVWVLSCKPKYVKNYMNIYAKGMFLVVDSGNNN